MEYITLVSRQRWTSSNPAIYFSLFYKYRREDECMIYQFKIVLHALTGSSYFAYPIYLKINLNNVSSVYSATLKNYGTSYQTWSEKTFETGEIKTSKKLSGTTPVVFNFYSGYGSSRNTNYSYNLKISESCIVYINNETYQCYIGDGTNWTLHIPYIGDGTNWNEYGYS